MVARWKKLAFYQNGLALMTLADGKISILQKQSPNGAIFFPQSWSPNGRYIVMQPTVPEEQKPVVFDTKTGKNLGLTAGISSTWTSDNKLLSSIFGNQQTADANWLRITDPATGNYRTLLKDLGAAQYPRSPKGRIRLALDKKRSAQR